MALARYLRELAVGSVVKSAYVLRTKEMRVARSGDPYMTLLLADRTAEMPAVVFNPSRGLLDIPVGIVVHVGGRVTSYRGSRRIVAETVVPADQWDPADFIRVGMRPTEELTEEFKALVRSVENHALRRFLKEVFGRDEFFARFCSCPGTHSGHHAWAGGLLEHTVAVASLTGELCERHASLDRGLALTAALVHDIGVVDCLRTDSGIRRTDQGRLIGHITLGVMRAHAGAVAARLDPEESSRIIHAVASHHGTGAEPDEHGPVTAEAVALLQADRADRELGDLERAQRAAASADERWTGSDNVWGRQMRTQSHSVGSAAVGDRIAPLRTA